MRLYSMGDTSVAFPSYGGYIATKGDGPEGGTVVKARRYEKQSKEALPRYEPIPDCPIPPRGIAGWPACKYVL